MSTWSINIRTLWAPSNSRICNEHLARYLPRNPFLHLRIDKHVFSLFLFVLSMFLSFHFMCLSLTLSLYLSLSHLTSPHFAWYPITYFLSPFLYNTWLPSVFIPSSMCPSLFLSSFRLANFASVIWDYFLLTQNKK